MYKTVTIYLLVSICHARSLQDSNHNQPSNNDSIIFPDQTPHIIRTRMPSLNGTGNNCILGICDEIDNYPSDLIRNALKTSHKVFQDYFKAPEMPFSITDRHQFIDDDNDGQSLCEVRVHTQYPKVAKNLNKVERIIINVDDYQQALKFEICAGNNHKCMFSELLPSDYESNCVQRFAVRRLMALGDEQKPIFDSFEVPSCCVCTYKKKTN